MIEKYLGAIILFTILFVFFSTVFIANKLAEYSCVTIGKQMNKEVSYSFVTDCMIKVEGNWIPLDKYRKF